MKAEEARQRAVEKVYSEFKVVAHEMVAQARQSLANARHVEALANDKHRELEKRLELAQRDQSDRSQVVQRPLEESWGQPDVAAQFDSSETQHEHSGRDHSFSLAIIPSKFMNEVTTWEGPSFDVTGYTRPVPEFDGLASNNPPVLGAIIRGTPKAYPFPVIAEQGVINDTVGMDCIVVTFDPVLAAGAMFCRKLGSITLTFEVMTQREDGLMLMQDRETGNVWQALTGRAIHGPLSGSVLDEISCDFSTLDQWVESYSDTEFAE